MREDRFGDSFLVNDNGKVYGGVYDFFGFVDESFVGVVNGMDEVVDGFVGDDSFVVVEFVGDRSIEIKFFIIKLCMLVEFFDVVVVVFYNFVNRSIFSFRVVFEVKW